MAPEEIRHAVTVEVPGASNLPLVTNHAQGTHRGDPKVENDYVGKRVDGIRAAEPRGEVESRRGDVGRCGLQKVPDHLGCLRWILLEDQRGDRGDVRSGRRGAEERVEAGAGGAHTVDPRDVGLRPRLGCREQDRRRPGGTEALDDRRVAGEGGCDGEHLGDAGMPEDAAGGDGELLERAGPRQKSLRGRAAPEKRVIWMSPAHPGPGGHVSSMSSIGSSLPSCANEEQATSAPVGLANAEVVVVAGRPEGVRPLQEDGDVGPARVRRTA